MVPITLSLVALLSSADPATAPRFAVYSTAASVPTGELARLGEDWSVELAGKPVKRIPGSELVELRRLGVAVPSWPDEPHLVFANGDRLPAEIVGSEGPFLLIRSRWAAESAWKVPLSMLSLGWVIRPHSRLGQNPAWQEWLRSSAKQDALLLVNGDIPRGTLLGLDADTGQVRFQPMGKEEITLKGTELAAIAFNPALTRNRPRTEPHALVVLTDGTRLTLRSASSDETQFRGTTFFRTELSVPLADMASLTVFRQKAVYLSDLTPSKIEQTPFFRLSWPWSADRAANGDSLTMPYSSHEAQSFDKGIGMHAQTRLTYQLDGDYRRFESWVGMQQTVDPQAPYGSAKVRVLVDGQERPEWVFTVAYGEKPRFSRVDLTDARELTIVVEFGRGGHVQDLVDWGNARLIK